ALTGETGAGKSILVDALNLLLGSRASPEMIRTGEEEAAIEAFFDSPDREGFPALLRLELDPSDGLLLKRMIHQSGKSRAFLNGSSITLHMLEEIGEDLIHIYGQHEHQHFLDPLRHIDILDEAGRLTARRQVFQEVHHQWNRAQAELEEWKAKQKQRADHLDLLTFQIKEIGQANLRPTSPNEPDEEKELASERSRLVHAEKLCAISQQGFEVLYGEGGSAVEGLKSTLQRLREGGKLDASLKPLADALEGALFQAEDVASSLHSYLNKIQFDPQRLEDIESRLNEIQKLKRKYGPSLADVLAYKEKIEPNWKRRQAVGERRLRLRRRNSHNRGK
ncbi:MAG: DNA repair protein RecN, partial [Deltaproteobacteria bacterium]|nr:DNA repair protein RecN [Deltaproteobacteria bacterium]